MNRKHALVTIFASLFLISGCDTFCPKKDVTVPPATQEVWTPPKINKPDRPVLRSSDAAKTDANAIRNVELDLFDLKTYALQLECIVDTIIKGEKNDISCK